MQDAAGTLGLALPLDLCHAMVGVPSHECNLMLQEHYGPGFDLTVFRGHFSKSVQRQMSERVPMKPGVVELLDFLRDRGLPLAIATSAGRATAERNLGRAGLLDRFDALATRDDVERPKNRRPTSTSKRRSGWAWLPSDVSPSKIRASASSPPTPPACGRSWSSTSCRRPKKRGPSASISPRT